jgi:hypothetical protein
MAQPSTYPWYWQILRMKEMMNSSVMQFRVFALRKFGLQSLLAQYDFYLLRLETAEFVERLVDFGVIGPSTGPATVGQRQCHQPSAGLQRLSSSLHDRCLGLAVCQRFGPFRQGHVHRREVGLVPGGGCKYLTEASFCEG